MPSNAAEAWAEQGRQLLGLGRVEQALSLFSKALSQDPENAYFWRLQAAGFYQLKDGTNALKSIETSLAKDAGDAEAHCLNAWIQMRYGSLVSLETSIQEALRLEPNHESALQCLCEFQIQMNCPEKAEQTALKLLEINPESSKAHQILGFLSFDRRQWQQALSHFSEALTKDPENGQIHFYRAKCLLRLQRQEEAIESLDAALRLDPANREFQITYQNAMAKKVLQWTEQPQNVNYNTAYPLILSSILRSEYWLQFPDFRMTFHELQNLSIGNQRISYAYFRLSGPADNRLERFRLLSGPEATSHPFRWGEKTYQMIFTPAQKDREGTPDTFELRTPAFEAERPPLVSTGFHWPGHDTYPDGKGSFTLAFAEPFTPETWNVALRKLGAFIENEKYGSALFAIGGHELQIDLDYQGHTLWHWNRDPAKCKQMELALGSPAKCIAHGFYNSHLFSLAVLDHLRKNSRCFLLED